MNKQAAAPLVFRDNVDEALQKLMHGETIHIEDLEVLAKTILKMYERGVPFRMKPAGIRAAWLGSPDTNIYELKRKPE